MSPNFKFMVSCLIIQKRENNIASETVAYWSEKTDGYAHCRWENRSILCLVHVFASAI